MKVYVLTYHSYTQEQIEILGVFDSREKAEEVSKQKQNERGYPNQFGDGYFVEEYEMNKPAVNSP